MILIKAENRELTLSISINQRNPSHEPEDPRHGVLLGTDFRHAVEFSRSGRARTPGLPAFVRGGSRCYALLSIGRYPGGFDRLAFRPARRREDTTPSCAPVQAPLLCGPSAWCNRDPRPGLPLREWTGSHRRSGSEAEELLDPYRQTRVPADLAHRQQHARHEGGTVVGVVPDRQGLPRGAHEDLLVRHETGQAYGVHGNALDVGAAGARQRVGGRVRRGRQSGGTPGRRDEPGSPRG